MSKYNTNTVPVNTRVTTLQGGQGFSQPAQKELIGLLSTGLSNTYYEKEGEREKRFAEVFNTVASKDKLFAAKALIYARTVFGQRTVTHYGAVELIKHLSGDPLGKAFFSKRDRTKKVGGIVYRIDDMNEILACYLAKNGAKASIPNSIKKGFKEAIENSDAYQLAKYQMKGKVVSLVDIVNIVHPVETAANGTVTVTDEAYNAAIKGTKFEKIGRKFARNEDTLALQIPALHALVIGLLKQFNTVEDKNTEVGQVVAAKVKSGEITKEAAQVELAESKGENFSELIKTGKIGYLALLRNLRNILKLNDSQLLIDACALLVQEKFIRNSLVWPHQIDLCNEILQSEFKPSELGQVLNALNTAYELSIPNLSQLMTARKTAVVYDSSGSMNSTVTLNDKARGVSSALDKAALIGATFAKGLNADVYTFSNSCKICSFNPTDSVNSIKLSIRRSAMGGGTSWGSIFPELLRNGGYERIIVISDEQSQDNALTSYKEYCSKNGIPYLYIVNICGYGPTVNIKENDKTFRLYGYTGDIYEKSVTAELNLDKVIDEINAILI